MEASAGEENKPLLEVVLISFKFRESELVEIHFFPYTYLRRQAVTSCRVNFFGNLTTYSFIMITYNIFDVVLKVP
jgi:hypothetical protein